MNEVSLKFDSSKPKILNDNEFITAVVLLPYLKEFIEAIRCSFLASPGDYCIYFCYHNKEKNIFKNITVHWRAILYLWNQENNFGDIAEFIISLL